MTKIILYAFFALIATTVNLLTQWQVFRIFEGNWVLFAALTAGTAGGLFTKYYLDKKWIFEYKPSSRQDDMSSFGLYSLMGVLTTVIFWFTETGFYYLFEFSGAQYFGGALGLAIGYSTKYLLDKKFVFREIG